MNARIQAPHSLGIELSELWDPELERNALGAAMLGEPMPAWLEPRHFFPTQHQRIYEAVQSVGGNVAHVNAWLRESSPKYGPLIAKADELAAMCTEAAAALRFGWAIEYERIRELWKQRQLVELMTREAIRLRGGVATHAEVLGALVAHGEEVCR